MKPYQPVNNIVRTWEVYSITESGKKGVEQVVYSEQDAIDCSFQIMDHYGPMFRQDLPLGERVMSVGYELRFIIEK
jgi:hypothetical protein